MGIVFKNQVIHSEKIKINGTIKKAIDAYRKKRVPMRVLLTNFLAVKSKWDELAEAENPWAYFYKGMEGHEIESGVSVDETLFRFATMEIKDQKPSDVINAAFFANKIRNDSDFELGYLLPLFHETIAKTDNLLFVNPSPDMVCRIEESCHKGRRYYAVSDSTVAGLYRIQFPEAFFCSFDRVQTIRDIDAVLITNRDQKTEEAQLMLECLKCCKPSGRILGLIPSAWFDNMTSGAYKALMDTGFGIEQILIVDTGVTVSTPKKKIVVYMKKGAEDKIELQQSVYNKRTRELSVSDEMISISALDYIKSGKTILSFWKAHERYEDDKLPKRKKAEEYKFSEEISIFYRIYADRKNKYAGVAFYREIIDTEIKTWGRNLSSNIEKGLRADTPEQVKDVLGRIVFDDSVYPIIRNDLEKKYMGAGRAVSLKTIWFYCWNSISEVKKYDHIYVEEMFCKKILSDIIPLNQSGKELLNAIAESLMVSIEDIPYKAIEQIDIILNYAIKQGIIKYNPLETYIREYSSRATERQQDVRNALVKKHFTSKEENDIFEFIIRKKNVGGSVRMQCTEKSLLLATAIRMFTGMSIREVAALEWDDYRKIPRIDDAQLMVSKFVDQNGKIMLHSERENWKRFRIVPVARALKILLDARKQYLVNYGIDEEFLNKCPIVLSEERLSDMKKMKKVAHCKPWKINMISNEVIKVAHIPEDEIILPDDKNDLVTDLNKYHGDIFLSNFRNKANHNAYMTMGEINYMIGVDAPDTFSRHYCDFTNDFIQEGIIQKLSRWEISYERILTGKRLRKPCYGAKKGNVRIKTGPFKDGVAALDLLIENRARDNVEVVVEGLHGIDVNITEY